MQHAATLMPDQSIDSDIKAIVSQRLPVFVALPDAQSLQTFIPDLSHLSDCYQLFFVFPQQEAATIYAMRAECTRSNGIEIPVKHLIQNVGSMRRLRYYSRFINAIPHFFWQWLGVATKYIANKKSNSLFHRIIRKIYKVSYKFQITRNEFAVINAKQLRTLTASSINLPISLSLATAIEHHNPLCILLSESSHHDFMQTVLDASAKENIPVIFLKTLHAKKTADYAKRLSIFMRDCVETEARRLRGMRSGCKGITISHTYGAHKIVKDYCDLPTSSLSIPGYWMHGWIPEYHNVDPLFIALHKKEGQSIQYDYQKQINEDKAKVPQWVARKDQATYLRAAGYQKVAAIGLPIVYLPRPSVRRVPGSLLVLPPHGHQTHGPDDPLAQEYAAMIAKLRSSFKHIWVGIYQNDLAKKQWLESFKKQGLPVFNTADQTDSNTLLRLALMFSTFEYVTTNGFGSHIALAAYFGAKVSVFGPYADYPRESMKDTHAIKMFPDLLDKKCALHTQVAFHQHYDFLFKEPQQAVVLTDWGAYEIGADCRLASRELMELFGWSTLNRTTITNA